MATKQTPRKTKPASGLKRTSRSVGDGITTRTVNMIDCTRSSGKAVVAVLGKVLAGPSLERFYRDYLREHGLTDDPGAGSFVDLLQRKDERRTRLWYAAAIVDEKRKEHAAIKRGDSASAARAGFRAGDLHREAALKFKWEPDVLTRRRSLKGSSKGGRHKKRRLGIEQAIRDCLAKSPALSARSLWNKLMRDGFYKIGEYTIEAIDADKGIEDQKLVEEGGPTDSVKYLKFRAFKNYVARLKK